MDWVKRKRLNCDKESGESVRRKEKLRLVVQEASKGNREGNES